jgi:hypothetical protein
MPKIITDTKKQISKMEHGQVLLVVAISIVVIVAVIGLALDVGVMFIGNARMRRAVDAAALAAALQFHPKGVVQFDFNDLDTSATEFLQLNGMNNILDIQAIVQICDTPDVHPPDSAHTIPADLCPQAGQMQRKLVRVVAAGRVPLAFLPVIGINSIPIGANAISETASVDVVLVIDRSESMTYNAAPDTAARDPSKCNIDNTPPPATLNWDASYQGNCEPFFDVKYAAVKFVESLYFPYDRVSVITFDKDSTVVMNFSNDKNQIINNIKGLTVFQGDTTMGPDGINAIYPIGNPSRYYDMSDPLNPIYKGLACPQREISTEPHYPDPSPCTTTNIGLGMLNAGGEFTINTALVPQRKNSLWVTILLTDGVANAGYDLNHLYYCPAVTWPNVDTYDFSVTPPHLLSIDPKCNDADSSTHHTPPSSPSSYDAEDYAYDQVDNVVAEQSLIFTIGLGNNVITPSSVDGTNLGELFLKYAAAQGEGLYSFAPDSSQLEDVFVKIASNIATRLEH